MVTVYASGRGKIKFEDCNFYHTVEVPGIGTVTGEWDLRGHVDEYLGGYNFSHKRVLEIGPASGFLTFEMERRRANVVALEVPDDPGGTSFRFPMMFYTRFFRRAVSTWRGSKIHFGSCTN